MLARASSRISFDQPFAHPKDGYSVPFGEACQCMKKAPQKGPFGLTGKSSFFDFAKP
jgi:hypothetical protein